MSICPDCAGTYGSAAHAEICGGGQASLLDRHADVLASHAVHPEPATLDEFARYKVATLALRDAELALRDAQAKYRTALEELNKAIAPIPGQP